MRLPAEPRPEGLTVVIDTREQYPLDLSPMQMVRDTLTTGDYSVVGLTNVIAIERKSADDMLACIGRERERFDREVQRLLAFPVRALVIEAGWQFFERGEWRGDVTPNAATGSLLGWVVAGLPIVMAYDHERAGRFVGRMLYIAARRRWREARSLIQSVQEARRSDELESDQDDVLDPAGESSNGRRTA